jgi:hypothetical protein
MLHDGTAPRDPSLIVRDRVRRVDEEIHETGPTLSAGGAALEELGSGLDGADLLGYGGGDPLVEGNSVFLGEALVTLIRSPCMGRRSGSAVAIV